MDITVLKSACVAARVHAIRLGQRHGLSKDDREDMEQELLVDLLRRLGKYDPSRGSPNTFTGRVAHNRRTQLSQSLVDARRLFVTFSDLAMQPAANEDEAMDPEEWLEGEPLWGEVREEAEEVHVASDLELALAHMDPWMRSFFQLLQSAGDPPRALAVSGLSSATFYRRLNDLRMFLRMFGIGMAA